MKRNSSSNAPNMCKTSSMRPVSSRRALLPPPAIAEEISRITVDALQEQMEVKPNTGFNPRRRVIPPYERFDNRGKTGDHPKESGLWRDHLPLRGHQQGVRSWTRSIPPSPQPRSTRSSAACAPAWAGARAASVPRWSRRSSARRRGFPQRRSPKAGRILT